MRTLPSGRKWKLHEYGSHWILWLWTLLLSLLLLIVYNIPDFWLKKRCFLCVWKQSFWQDVKMWSLSHIARSLLLSLKDLIYCFRTFFFVNLQHLLNNSQLLGIVMMIRDRANFEKHFIMVGFPVASYNVKVALM